MAQAEQTVIIQRPVRSVFDFVLNGANNRLWRNSVLEARPLSEAPFGSGSKFQQRIEGPEGPIEGEYEVTQCRENELIELKMRAGGLRLTSRFHFRPEGAATELTVKMKAVSETSPELQGWLEAEAGMLGELKAFLEKHA